MAYGIDTDAMAEAIITSASNLPNGNTSVFSIEDFLLFFPQFKATHIISVSVNSGGSGYSIDDVLTIVQSGATGGTAQVLDVEDDGATLGIITSVALRTSGEDYSSFNGLATTVSPAGGTGCTLNISTSAVSIPSDLLDMFMAMAYSSVLESRWKTKWKYAMSLYMAHFITLWLKTQNGANSTIAQMLSNAQTMFSTASKGVGDVSVSYDTSSISGSLPGWGMWTTTTYGAQLAQFAAFLPGARAGMYVR